MRLLFEGTCAPGDDHSDVAGSRRTTEGCALMGDQASASEAIFEYYVAQQHKQSAASAEQLSLSGIRMRAVALNPQPLPPENACRMVRPSSSSAGAVEKPHERSSALKPAARPC